MYSGHFVDRCIGLPLAVTLALAFATKRMSREQLLVRILGSCETMANVSVMCTDKTGTLTQNVMTVVAGTVGVYIKFATSFEGILSDSTSNQDDAGYDGGYLPTRGDVVFVDKKRLNSVLAPEVRALLNAAISINSTAFEDVIPDSGMKGFVGNKTETALLTFAKDMRWENYRTTRESARIVQIFPFSSSRKVMGVVLAMGDGRWRLHVKGASEILSKRCTHYVVMRRGEVAEDIGDVSSEIIDDVAEKKIGETIDSYASQTLRTISLCYKDFEVWPPGGCMGSEVCDKYIIRVIDNLKFYRPITLNWCTV